MSYEFYKVLHIFGIVLVLLALGGYIGHFLSGGTRENFVSKKFFAITHGLGMLVIFVAGFGLIARLQTGFPGWILVKLVIWLLIGGMIAFIPQKPKSKVFWITAVILVTLAAYLARYRPF